MDYWKIRSGIFALLFGVASADAVKCYLYRATNDTGEITGHWGYCVTGCCHDHCCDKKTPNSVNTTETLAMVFCGLFVLGAFCIILSWVRIGKTSRHIFQRRRSEVSAPIVITEQGLTKGPTPDKPAQSQHCSEKCMSLSLKKISGNSHGQTQS